MREFGWPCIAAAGTALLLEGAAAYSLESRLANDAKALEYIRGEVAKVWLVVEDLRHLPQAISSVQTCQAVSAGFQKRRNLPILILAELARVRPDGMRFTVVDQRDGAMSLKGEAGSELAIAELVKRIEGSAVLERPSVRPVAGPQAGSSPGYPVAFEIGMRVRGRPQ